MVCDDDGMKLLNRAGLSGELQLLGIESEWHGVQAQIENRLLLLKLTSKGQEQQQPEVVMEEEAISGVVDLAVVKKVELLPSPASKERRVFTVFLQGQSLTLQAETSQEAEQWMKALQSANNLPSGSCEGDKHPLEPRSPRQSVKDEAEQINNDVGEPSTVEKPARGEERTVEKKTPIQRTPNRTWTSSNGDSGGVRFVGAYNPRSTSGNRGSHGDRRASRGGEAWRQKENLAPQMQQHHQQHQGVVPSVRDALSAESMEEPTVQVEKRTRGRAGGGESTVGERAARSQQHGSSSREQMASVQDLPGRKDAETVVVGDNSNAQEEVAMVEEVTVSEEVAQTNEGGCLPQRSMVACCILQ